MNILVSNDDGWGMGGIMALIKALAPLGHIDVVAPEGPRSGAGASLTIGKPLQLRALGRVVEDLDVDVYLTNGTPSDCVKLALNTVYAKKNCKPDLIASGINHGSNTSINSVYSGTLGICRVGAEHDILSIGFSLCDHSLEADFSEFAACIPDLVKELSQRERPYGCFYNINAPVGKLEGIQYTRQCKGWWTKELDLYRNENGSEMYMLVGEFVNAEPDQTDTDEWAVNHHKISITPMTVDSTMHPNNKGFLIK